GVDAHALVAGVPLVLGGVELEHPRGLAGHSDGDVLAHALTDALLGAAGLGDIGGLFPSGDEDLRGVSSLALLADASAPAEAAAAGVLFAAVGASARHSAGGDVNWLHWGNTPDQNRYSPADQITPSNVGQLGRSFIVDLNKIIPGIKKGQQSYPLEVNGTLYFTSANDQVFAVNATTGDLFWKYAPNNLAVFTNFGIVANRGVAYCDNRIFLLTLDMTIVSLDAATGKELQ